MQILTDILIYYVAVPLVVSFALLAVKILQYKTDPEQQAPGDIQSKIINLKS